MATRADAKWTTAWRYRHGVINSPAKYKNGIARSENMGGSQKQSAERISSEILHKKRCQTANPLRINGNTDNNAYANRREELQDPSVTAFKRGWYGKYIDRCRDSRADANIKSAPNKIAACKGSNAFWNIHIARFCTPDRIAQARYRSAAA